MDGYVDHDKMKQLVSYSYNVYDGIKDNSSNIIKSIRGVNDTCHGKTIDFMISPIVEQTNTFERLDKVFMAYIDTLIAVGKAYKMQDVVISQQLNQLASKNVKE